MANNITKFHNKLSKVHSRYSTNEIKRKVKNSTNNHRTVSVNQLLRFIKKSKSPYYSILGHQLERVYQIIRPSMGAVRMGLNRTDSYEVREFFMILSLVNYLKRTSPERKSILRALSK